MFYLENDKLEYFSIKIIKPEYFVLTSYELKYFYLNINKLECYNLKIHWLECLSLKAIVLCHVISYCFYEGSDKLMRLSLTRINDGRKKFYNIDTKEV